MGEVMNKRASVGWIDHGATHPSIARCFLRTELNNVCSEGAVSTDAEVGGWNDCQSS